MMHTDGLSMCTHTINMCTHTINMCSHAYGSCNVFLFQNILQNKEFLWLGPKLDLDSFIDKVIGELGLELKEVQNEISTVFSY